MHWNLPFTSLARPLCGAQDRQPHPTTLPEQARPPVDPPFEQMPCPSSSQGLSQMGLSGDYLLLEKGLWLALAVRLDAANVVGCGAVQDQQELFQRGLWVGETWA